MAEIVSNQIPQDLKQIQAWVFWKFNQFPDEIDLKTINVEQN